VIGDDPWLGKSATILLLCLFIASACAESNPVSTVLPASPKDTGSAFQPPDSLSDVWLTPEDTLESTDEWEYLLPPCGDEKVQVTQQVNPANIMVVMDRSGSMEGEKWEETQAAISAVLGSFDQFIHFGLFLYPQKGSSCVQTPILDVPFGLNQGDALVAKMAAMGTGGGTPTAGALGAAAQVFMSTPLVGDRYVIVATDGQPTCLIDCAVCPSAFCPLGICEACINDEPCLKKEVINSVKQLKLQGIPTFVIGIAGSQSAKSVLNEMALIGGTAKTTDPKYYDTANGEELTEVLASIFGSVGSCSVKLNKTPGSLFLIVDINGETVEKDPSHQNGWDLIDGDILQFYGNACELASQTGADVNVTYVCKYADQ
jgi:hypothetical protein